MVIPLPFGNMIRELVVFLIKNLEVLIQLIHCPGLQRFSTESVGGMKEGVVERNLNMYDHIMKYPYKYMVYLLQCIQFGSAKKLYCSCISAIVLQQMIEIWYFSPGQSQHVLQRLHQPGWPPKNRMILIWLIKGWQEEHHG